MHVAWCSGASATETKTKLKFNGNQQSKPPRRAGCRHIPATTTTCFGVLVRMCV